MEVIKSLRKYLSLAIKSLRKCSILELWVIFVLAIIGLAAYLILPLIYITTMCVLCELDNILEDNNPKTDPAYIEPTKSWPRR